MRESSLAPGLEITLVIRRMVHPLLPRAGAVVLSQESGSTGLPYMRPTIQKFQFEEDHDFYLAGMI